MMENGQTINIVANETYRELYFALKKEEFETEEVSEEFMAKAKKEIDDRLKMENVNVLEGVFESKKYVF